MSAFIFLLLSAAIARVLLDAVGRQLEIEASNKHFNSSRIVEMFYGCPVLNQSLRVASSRPPRPPCGNPVFHYSGQMETTTAITIMSALAQPTRMAVFSLLTSAGSEGMTAGELAERTATPSNTMSAHLLILSRAGLATSRRAGRNIFYAAKTDGVGELIVLLESITRKRTQG